MGRDGQLAQRLSKQIAVASDLLEFGLKLPAEKDLHSVKFPRDSVVTVVALFTKAHVTFQAIVVLCADRLERPATALNRSLFETLINLAFLTRKRVTLSIFNDSKRTPKSPWPLHGKTLTPEFRLTLFNAWSILRDEKSVEGWRRTPGLKQHGRRTSKRSAQIDRSYANAIGPDWEKAIKNKNTCVGLDIANFAASLGPVFRRWYRSVYAQDSAFIHQSDATSYLELTKDGNFAPRLFTSAKEVSGVLHRAAVLYLGCIDELNKRFRFGSMARNRIDIEPVCRLPCICSSDLFTDCRRDGGQIVI